MQISDFARIRRFLGLTQFDVAVGTGVPLGRIGLAERGRIQVNACEEKAISNFLESRLKIALEGTNGEKCAVSSAFTPQLAGPA